MISRFLNLLSVVTLTAACGPRAAVSALSITHVAVVDVERGTVLFRHDGTNAANASFDVVVADHAGATSGAAQTVNVSVRA